jgi:hypothetical protein
MRPTLAALMLVSLAAGLVRGQVPGRPPETLSSRLQKDFTLKDRLAPVRGGLDARGPSQPPTAPLPPVSRFAEPGSGPPSENLISFDPRRVELKRQANRWQILAGTLLVKDFGANEEIARETLRLIRDLGLSQRGTIGRPRPIMEYWLASGAAPQPGTQFRRLIPFNTGQVRVELFQAQWCVRDDQQVLMAFGPFQQDAQAAVEIIRRHNFGKMGMVGTGPEGLMFFVAAPVPLAGPNSEPTTAAPVGQKPAVNMARINPRQMALAGDLPPDAGIPGQRTRFDWRKVEVIRDQGHWKLMESGLCLADYGLSEYQAREALRVLRQYHFTDQYRIGTTARPLTFYLTNDKAPRGVPFDLRAQPFHLDALEIRPSSSGWALCDGQRQIWDFGADKDEADKALKAMRMLKFDHLCQVGDAGPAPLTFLVRDR